MFLLNVERDPKFESHFSLINEKRSYRVSQKLMKLNIGSFKCNFDVVWDE